MHCIITGFDDFGGLQNPTQHLIAALPSKLSTGGKTLSLNKAVLSTCCEESWATLEELFKQARASEHEQVLVILTGLDSLAEKVQLERFALNIRDYRIADNNKHFWQNQSLDARGPEAIKTNLPIEALEKHLLRRKIDCDISNHAGAFICNEVYYRALRFWQSKRAKQAYTIFVHVPPCSKASGPPSKKDLKPHLDALEETIRYCANWISKAGMSSSRFSGAKI